MCSFSLMDKFSFLVDWYDPESTMTRKFVLSWYPVDETVELYDLKFKRLFLKRVKVDKISLDDIYVGNSIVIFARQLKITDYANEYTRQKIGQTVQRIFLLIKPEVVKNKAKILQMVSKSGFKICNLKMLNMLRKQVEDLYEGKKSDPQFALMTSALLAGPVIPVDLVAVNGIELIKELAGADDPEAALKEHPGSIRALYGVDLTHNAVYFVTAPEQVKRAVSVAFRKPELDEIPLMSTAVLEDSTCCIIKPHAIREGLLADILMMAEEYGYTITAMEMFCLDHINAGEFLEVYNGVVPEFPEMVRELLTGPCLVMEVTGPMKEETSVEFRKFVGPSDPDIARQLRPNTLRAKFGKNKIENGVHVTDLPEDAILEVEYFFRIMQL